MSKSAITGICEKCGISFDVNTFGSCPNCNPVPSQIMKATEIPLVKNHVTIILYGLMMGQDTIQRANSLRAQGFAVHVICHLTKTDGIRP